MTDKIKFPKVDAKGYLLNGVNLNSDHIENESNVSGATVTAALNSIDSTIQGLAGSGSIPTKLSELLNDVPYATESWVTGQGYVTADTKYTAGTGLNLIGEEFSVKIGTSSGTVAAGDDSRIVNAIPNTRKINDKDLTQDITLTKSDVGLSNVDNTADENKVVASASKLTTPVTINGEQFDGSSNITINAVDSTARIASSEKGQANGVATLDSTGKVPSSQLPSYVDDVVEADDFDVLPATGETDKIYVTKDDGFIYRWSGSQYVRINDAVSIAEEATKLETPRKIEITGDGTWEVEFDGSSNKAAALTLANTGVAAGDYTKVTVDTKGRVTNGSNPTTLAGYGITDGVKSDDARLSDARDWSANTVTKTQAENNTDTTTYKWTPQRVWDAITKFFNDNTTAFTRTILGKTDAAGVKTELGLDEVANVDTTTSDNITNGSNVAGSKVSDALNNLDTKIDDYNSIKGLQVKSEAFSVDEADWDLLYQVGHNVNDIVITLGSVSSSDPFLIRFKRPIGKAEVSFASGGNPFTDIDGNGLIREGGMVIAYWDGANWSIHGNLKYA